ncbi:MAG TPA: metallopeptidase family protein [Kofleriaceae bacterium]|nr:metallopeptidase family protein [Kofleriaceae bacterium]
MSRTDRLHADLERGFIALDEGNIDAAAAVLERCRRIDRKHPDVVALAAGVADARGDAEEAMTQYRKLAELRPDEPMPRICIARLELHDQEDPDAALEQLEAAFELIDEEADLIEAIYVKTEALLAREELEEARATLAELASSAIEDGDLALDLAELALAAEDPQAAIRWTEAAHKADPELAADAMHARGRAHELAGDRPAMIAAWKEVRRLDLAAPPGPVHVTEDELERIAAATLAALPQHIRDHLERVPILIDDAPSEDILDDGFDPRLLGLFQGTPMPEDGALAPSVTNILLFKRNLERMAEDEEHLAEEVRITVLHETAHYFGLDEDDLEALGLD